MGSIPFLTGTANSYVSTFRADSTGVTVLSYSDSVTVRVVSTASTFGSEQGLTLLESSRKGTALLLQRVWYRAALDTLTEVAYQFLGRTETGGSLSGFPKREQNTQAGVIITQPAAVQMLLRLTTVRDSAVKRNDPRIVYQFPLVLGKQWISFRSPFLQKREVLGIETMSVRAGTFVCMKIRSTIDTTWSYDDYVAPQGLVLRTLSWTVPVTTKEAPDGNGTFYTISERMELIEQH
jgi:hypothetical protein